MYFLLVITLVAAPVLGADPQLYASKWNQFKNDFQKDYKNQFEEETRLKVFASNLELIEEHNKMFEAGLETYEMGINQFADMTDEEYLNYLNLSQPILQEGDVEEEKYEVTNDLELPASKDYRKLHAVNAVKNQKSCGSCWAFSVVSAIESAYYLKYRRLYRLSEQELVDCSRGYGNKGCSGGNLPGGFRYVKDHGLRSEASYPYKAKNGKCKKGKGIVKIRGFKRVKSGSELALQSAVARIGPVSVAVDASQFKHYKRGIFAVKHWGRLNHAVVVVGYGTQGRQPYWIVRNSWGKIWGEQGYIRIARNRGNQVGIASDSVYPVL